MDDYTNDLAAQMLAPVHPYFLRAAASAALGSVLLTLAGVGLLVALASSVIAVRAASTERGGR